MVPEQRRIKRQRVVKLGKIIFGASDVTINCVIYDESAYGILAETETPVSIPEEVRIRTLNGGTFPAIRRWALGNKIGFEFIGTQLTSPTTIIGMSEIRQILQTQGIGQAVLSLRRSRFFDNEEIRRAAEEGEAATIRLERLLLGN